MGRHVHEAVLAVTAPWRPGGLPDVEAFRASLPEWVRPLVLGPIVTPYEGFVSYLFLPDGSKEGWPPDLVADEARERFKALFRVQHDDGSSSDQVVHIATDSETGTRLVDVWPPDGRS